eukprot:31065-Rhodomonas_salina.1
MPAPPPFMRARAPVFAGSVFNFDKTFSGRSPFGIRYKFFLKDAVDDCEECLVHFPTMKKLAAEVQRESESERARERNRETEAETETETETERQRQKDTDTDTETDCEECLVRFPTMKKLAAE